MNSEALFVIIFYNWINKDIPIKANCKIFVEKFKKKLKLIIQ